MCYLIYCILMNDIKCLVSNKRSESGFSGAFLVYAWLVQQGTRLPRAWWQRVAVVPWLLASMLLTWAYSGAILANLTVRMETRPFSSLESFVNTQDDIKVGLFTSTYESVNTEGQNFHFLHQLNASGRLDVSEWKGTSYFLNQQLPRIESGSLTVYLHEPFIKHRLMRQDYLRTGKCRFYAGDEPILSVYQSIVLPKGSPMVAAFNAR